MIPYLLIPYLMLPYLVLHYLMLPFLVIPYHMFGLWLGFGLVLRLGVRFGTRVWDTFWLRSCFAISNFAIS